MELPPRSSGAPLEVIARQELARASRCEAGALELAWWELPGGARAAEGTHVMAVGCRHADAEPLVAAALSAGLDVAALDAPPTALARACAPLASPAPELTAIVSLGWTAAQLIMLAGPTLVYERTLGDSGLRLLHTAVANQLGADDELTRFLVRTAGCAQPAEGEAALEQAGEARSLVAAHADGVASEVRTGMSYAVRRFDAPLTRLVLAGGGAAVPGVPERLKERTGLDVRVARAGDLCPAAPGVAEEDLGPDMALALGLALHALDTKGGAA
jgi:Tfp pilus assembly PilM family ATPase